MQKLGRSPYASNDLITAILLVLHMRILFIAGFGPIPDYLLSTKKLYSWDLENEFHECECGYMHAQKNYDDGFIIYA